MGEEPVQIVLLTGPKHSGKTTAGRALAGPWGGRFIDLDDGVEKRTGKTPRTLFREGPEVFRAAEAEALAEVLESRERIVAAAGGGLADNGGAMELLKKARNLFIVCLDVPAETAWNRILETAAGGGLPPFLQSGNPRETHRRLHERRARVYRAIAHRVVSAGGKSPGAIAGEIMECMEYFITGVTDES
ncbi:MAG: shikimate kinase [Treponema sp.]|jgi:shikimate kinase|nr:shikimate kinase [Treponema sp.]